MRGQKRVEDARERAYDPRIHRKKRFIQADGLQRNSSLPEFRNTEAPQVGQARLAVSSPAMTADGAVVIAIGIRKNGSITARCNKHRIPPSLD
jgi:hypothetical protein